MNAQKSPTQVCSTNSTLQQHRRQTTWQILFPLILSILIILAIGIFSGIGTIRNAQDGIRWAGISTIFLIIPAMIWGILFLLLLGVLVFGLNKLITILPLYSLAARTYVYKTALLIRRWADLAVEPIIWPGMIGAGIKGAINALKKIFR